MSEVVKVFEFKSDVGESVPSEGHSVKRYLNNELSVVLPGVKEAEDHFSGLILPEQIMNKLRSIRN